MLFTVNVEKRKNISDKFSNGLEEFELGIGRKRGVIDLSNRTDRDVGSILYQWS